MLSHRDRWESVTKCKKVFKSSKKKMLTRDSSARRGRKMHFELSCSNTFVVRKLDIVAVLQLVVYFCLTWKLL